ncbi:MAG: hypothetical protein DWI63_00505 [Chloroflexi bacterium]|nr:MAG: hypothetical protein DWI62_02760 [Chloroflexota bacterium]RLT47445.1 MAG: hypothetical protein DWI63_00505 [Chloroflexota bacterium]RLT53469.1 MAG: hypothetical protein DWI68_00370 [Chloroflexota bacterium]
MQLKINRQWLALARRAFFALLLGGMVASAETPLASRPLAQARGGGGMIVNHVASWNGAEERWHPLGLGTDDKVFAATTRGTDLFIGGWFKNLSNPDDTHLKEKYIARWDGKLWSELGGGVNGLVYAIATTDTDLYAGGAFTKAGGLPANHMARWDGEKWHPLGQGLNGSVYAIAIDGKDVYAGGYFFRAGGLPASHVAKWDGTRWSHLSVGPNNWVHSLVMLDGELYAGGLFTKVDTMDANYIAKWNGSRWSRVGSGTDYWIMALVAHEGALYAGGYFTNAGGKPASHIAKWDGKQWSEVGGGVDGNVYALASGTGKLYAGGEMRRAGGGLVDRVASWDGKAWAPLGGGVDDWVWAIAPAPQAAAGTTAPPDDVFVGGWFLAARNKTEQLLDTRHIARWDTKSEQWAALGGGTDGTVYAIDFGNDRIYAGGDFKTAFNSDFSKVAANNIAAWDGQAWNPLGGGFNGVVYDIAFNTADDSLYAVGWFTKAYNFLEADGPQPAAGAETTEIEANRVARWTGSKWEPLNGGVNNRAYAVMLDGDKVYVAGDFSMAGDVVTYRTVSWSGGQWQRFGPEWNNRVYALEKSQAGIFVGGMFSSGGKTSRSAYFSFYDGSGWPDTGVNLNNWVHTVKVIGDDFYVGGWFDWATNPDGTVVKAERIAKWDGTTWSALGTGVSGTIIPSVYTIENIDGQIYAGGNFLAAGKASSRYVARWDGKEWHPLAVGVNDRVYKLAAQGQYLYLGGMFTRAGGLGTYFYGK